MKCFDIEPNYTVNNFNDDIDFLRSQLVEQYYDIVDQAKIETANAFEAKVKLHDSAEPIFCKSQPISCAIRPVTDAEIDQLIKSGIFELDDINEEPIKWPLPIVYVTKKCGLIRSCGNFKSTIKRYMIIEHYF